MAEGATKRDDAIHINGDGNFTTGNGVVSGNGTAGNPFIIKGWELTCSTTDSIKIGNTRKHLVIKDIIFNNTRSSGDRINLHNVTNVTVSNITVRQPGAPLEIRGCENVTVRNLTAYYTAWVGVHYSNWIDLFDVDISTKNGRFYVVLSNDTRFINCHTSNSYQSGFRMQAGKRISIIGCTTEKNAMGVNLGATEDFIVKRCTFMNSTGVEATIGGKNHTFIQNKFGKNGIDITLKGWHNLDRTNTVDGKPLQYYINETGKTLTGDIRQIYLVGCSYFIVKDIVFDSVKYPINCYQIRECVFQNLMMKNATRCIAVDSAYDCDFEKITGVPTRLGISLTSVANCTLKDFHFKADLLGGSSYTFYAMQFYKPDNVTLMDTVIEGKYQTGINIEHIDSHTGSAELYNVTVAGTSMSPGAKRGIKISRMLSVIIANSTVRDHENYNVYANKIGTFVVRDSTLFNSSKGEGLNVRECGLVHLTGNTLRGHLVGINVEDPERCVIDSNRVDDCSWFGIGTGLFQKEANITNNTVSNCTEMAFSIRSNSTVAHNKAWGCKSGFDTNGKNITLFNNTVWDCSLWAISASYMLNSTIRDNVFDNCNGGVRIWYCFFTRVFRNTINNGSVGLYLQYGQNCTISFNTVEDNSDSAFSCSYGFDNLVHHNIIIRNNYDPDTGQYTGPQASVANKGTEFDTGYAGNYWGDYQSRYPDAKQAKGVWDTPYVLWGNKVVDAFPLASLVRDISPPIAVVSGSTDVTVDQNSTVDLDGGGSTDNVGITGYFWTFEYGGEPVNLSGPLVQFMFDLPGVYVVTFTVFDAWSNSDTVELTITVVDTQAPVAIAGGDITVGMGESFTLNATASWDNGMIANVTWTVDPGGLDIIKSGLIVILAIDLPGQYLAVLNVTDGFGNWATDGLTITVEDRVFPVANAGKDITIIQGNEVRLDGSGSSDNVGVANWTWTFTYDSEERTLYGERPTFVFHTVGTYTITLTVRDEWGNFDYDSVTIKVIMEDTEPPVADAGGDITVNEGTELDLSAGYSTDNAGIVNYTWVIDYQGEEHEQFGEMISFFFILPGVYSVTLTVTDVGSNTDETTITVTVSDITVPVASFTLPSEVDEGEEVTLDGTSSWDNVGIILFTWTIYEIPNPIEVEGEQATYAFQMVGEITVTLTVVDAAGLFDSKNLIVNVLDRTAPVAHAGEDVTVIEGDMLGLDGTGSTDNVGVQSYLWTITFGDNEWTLESATVTFTFDQVGEYNIILDIIDKAGNAGRDTIAVTVVSRYVEWRVGPFVDKDGQPVGGVNITVTLNREEYTGTTDPNGHVELQVDRKDLVGQASITAYKDGWKPLEFNLDLDDEGNPTGDIPPMARVTDPSDPGDPGDTDGDDATGLSSTTLAILIALAAVVIIGYIIWIRKRVG